MRGALVMNEEVAIGGFVGHQTARAGTDNTCRAIWIGDRHFEAGHAHRLVGGDCGEPGVAVGERNDAVALEVLEAGFVIEVLDLRGNEDLQILERKAAERADARFPGTQSGPELVHRCSDGRYSAHAGDDDAPLLFSHDNTHTLAGACWPATLHSNGARTSRTDAMGGASGLGRIRSARPSGLRCGGSTASHERLDAINDGADGLEVLDI